MTTTSFAPAELLARQILYLQNRRVASIPISQVPQAQDPISSSRKLTITARPDLLQPPQGKQRGGSPHALHRDRQPLCRVHRHSPSLPAPWGAVSRADLCSAPQVPTASAWLLALSLGCSCLSSWCNCSEQPFPWYLQERRGLQRFAVTQQT